MTRRGRTAHRELTDFLCLALAVVFLVRTFVGEPFGVPTGSMAPTLLGAHKLIHCPECGKTFPVGADDPDHPPVLCLCPACGTSLDIAAAPVKRGDRIIVLKGPPTPLKRWDVAVFKFPDEPQKLYVKRIIGLPGERLRIRAGEIELWDEQQHRWTIARKPAELAKEMAIPVWEDEYQNPRVASGWKALPNEAWSKENDAWISKGAGELCFQRFAPDAKPLLIGDDLGYNQGLPVSRSANSESYWNKPANPVGDLSLSFDVEQFDGPIRLNLDIVAGQSLLRLEMGDSDDCHLRKDDQRVKSWDWKTAARYRLSAGVIDRRFGLWINNVYVGEWIDNSESGEDIFNEHSLTPFRIIASAGTRISNLRISRDVYYTQQPNQTDFLATDAGRDLMGDVNQFKRFREARQRTREFTVPADSYFALGDNSSRSHDSRSWKHGPYIPSRLIVGRVLFGPRP